MGPRELQCRAQNPFTIPGRKTRLRPSLSLIVHLGGGGRVLCVAQRLGFTTQVRLRLVLRYRADRAGQGSRTSSGSIALGAPDTQPSTNTTRKKDTASNEPTSSLRPARMFGPDGCSPADEEARGSSLGPMGRLRNTTNIAAETSVA